MGCIPVVKTHTTHLFENSDLPILFVNDWNDFNYEKADEIVTVSEEGFNSELLTMTYWKNKIYGELFK